MRNFQSFIAVLLCLGALSAQAQKESRRASEGPGDLIEKARNLSLQKDRTQATHILVTGMKRELTTSASFREMRAALEEISKAFLSEKAQHLYELALSLRKSDPRQSLAKLQEALRAEPDNLEIQNELARVQIHQGDCESAAESLAKIRQLNPFDEQTLLTSAQAAVCLNDWPLYTSLRSQAEGIKGTHRKTWLSLEVERAYREKSESRGMEAYLALKQASSDHPDLAFWEWWFAKTPEKKAEAANIHLANCRGLTSATLRRFLTDPFLCKRVNETERYLKPGGAS